MAQVLPYDGGRPGARSQGKRVFVRQQRELSHYSTGLTDFKGAVSRPGVLPGVGVSPWDPD